MFAHPYFVELLTPKCSATERLGELLDTFAERYERILAAGCGLSIPDNPMGQPRLSALECLRERNLSIDPDKVVVNLNTFHAKSELDDLLRRAAEVGLRFILVVRGDGGPLLSKLDPQSIGGSYSVATSIDLIGYINRTYPDQFITGAAFNPYNPMPFELNRMRRKIDAGARFAVTQPIIGRDEKVDRLMELGLPVVPEAWMSENIDLFHASVGKAEEDRSAGYDPVENLKALHAAYPERCIYLSMLSFKRNWREILPRL